jgi:predicted nucleic acid binding AN1-type Zn finger protein
MPCQLCKKKCGVPIDCNYCEGSFCSSCINLSKHDCQGADIKKLKQLKELKESTDFTPEPKLAKI